MSLTKEGIAELHLEKSVASVDQGDPFAVKFVGTDFVAIYPYHNLINATLTDNLLSIRFSGGVLIQCKGTNLLHLLDALWTTRLLIVARRSLRHEKPTPGEAFVEEIELVQEET